ncbi:ATP-citrate synthase beta chain protein 2 [Glycine soja]|uniref:ATP-citrate synthase beta chain protein 2 n=1 Tax=Glycine soja TaxID=3848 RepID=A0A445J058_GLYSO|nr:ATP-citrate synthase beta chain protein 2 [Glycine soja]
MESAQAKNQALKEAGVVVPTSFKAFEDEIMETLHKLVEEGNITPIKEFAPPPIPEDLNTTIRSGKVRAPTHIISTISDDRGLLTIGPQFGGSIDDVAHYFKDAYDKALDLLHQWSSLLLKDQWKQNGNGKKMIGDATSWRR